MPELVADCPRCGTRHITFDVMQAHIVAIHYGWQQWYEAFCVCRHCNRSTIFVLSEKTNIDYQMVHKVGLLNLKGSVNHYVTVEGYISLRDAATADPPEHVPAHIEAAFKEGATCLSGGCYNAAGTMFRLCVDFATKSKLPGQDIDGLNAKIRRSLGLRLVWLFDHGCLPEALRELSSTVKEDGNDGAHVGSLKKEDAEDLLDFTVALLERMYTEPERLRLATQRRQDRRATSTST